MTVIRDLPVPAVWHEIVADELERVLPDPELSDCGEPRLRSLVEAMRYSLLGPGKRIRPLLTLAVVDAWGGDVRAAAPLAVATECVHACSLVHDDLPSMDDDDLRRGRPTSHIKFGEATAILVGDALQTIAFACCARSDLPATVRIEAVDVLARATGWEGMVGGQHMDISPETSAPQADIDPIDAVRAMHDRKTGALLAASLEIGAVFVGAHQDDRRRVAALGREMGWLFQLVDDLLDVVGDRETIGKPQGSDDRMGKNTAVAAFGGVEELRTACDTQVERCCLFARDLPSGGGRLSDLARFIRQRDR